MSEENYAESITPHHLLYGRDINRKNSDINYFMGLSEASDARKQLPNLQQIVSHINKRFYNEYIIALRERHQYDRQSHHPHLQNVSIGDIVVVKDVNLPRLRWRKGRITKLIKGNDGLVRGVSLDTVVSTTNKMQCINWLLQHITQRAHHVESTLIRRGYYVDTSKTKFRRISTSFPRTFSM